MGDYNLLRVAVILVLVKVLISWLQDNEYFPDTDLVPLPGEDEGSNAALEVVPHPALLLIVGLGHHAAVLACAVLRPGGLVRRQLAVARPGRRPGGPSHILHILCS